MRIHRWQLKSLLDTICDHPWRVLAIKAVRRTPVFWRYAPIDSITNGAMVRCGDYCNVNDRNPNVVYNNGERFDITCRRRSGRIIPLQNVGDSRWMVVKNYNRRNGNQSSHAPELTGNGRHYDPLDYDLYPLAGFYSDAMKQQPSGFRQIGRFGEWRPYSQVCLRGTEVVRAFGETWEVIEPPQNDPIRYPTAELERMSRKHVVTSSGMQVA